MPEEFSKSKRYLDWCFRCVFLEVLPKSNWKICNALRLSIFPSITLISGIFIIYDFLKILSAMSVENQTKFSYLIVYFGAIYQFQWKYFTLIAYGKEYQRIVEFIDDIRLSTSIIRKTEFRKPLKIALLCIQ